MVLRAAWVPERIPGILASLIIVFIPPVEEFAFAFIIWAPNFTTIPPILVAHNVIFMLGLEPLLKPANPAKTGVKG